MATFQRFLTFVDRWLGQLSPGQIGAVTLALLLPIGVADYMAGSDVSLSIIYLLPIGIGAWYGGERAGVLASVLSAIFNRSEDFEARIAFQRPWLTTWNIFLDLGFMLAFTYLLMLLRERLAFEQRVARTDVLTGIFNRRAFMEQLEYLLELAARESWPISLIYVDVDDFKNINDQKGHAEGDKVLRLISRRLSEAVRHTDVVGRLGGDEFALILPHTDQPTAQHLIENLARVLETDDASSAELTTFSIGCVTLHAPISAEHALKEADKLMYEAKKRGKRQIVFAEPQRAVGWRGTPG